MPGPEEENKEQSEVQSNPVTTVPDPIPDHYRNENVSMAGEIPLHYRKVPLTKDENEEVFVESQDAKQFCLNQIKELIRTQQTDVEDLRLLRDFLIDHKERFCEILGKSERGVALSYIESINAAVRASEQVTPTIINALVDNSTLIKKNSDDVLNLIKQNKGKLKPEHQKEIEKICSLDVQVKALAAIQTSVESEHRTAAEKLKKKQKNKILQKNAEQLASKLKGLTDQLAAIKPILLKKVADATPRIEALILGDQGQPKKYALKFNGNNIDIVDNQLTNVKYVTGTPEKDNLNFVKNNVNEYYLFDSLKGVTTERNLTEMQQAISKSLTTNVGPVLGHYALSKIPKDKQAAIDALWIKKFGRKFPSFFSYTIKTTQRGPRFDLFFRSEKGSFTYDLDTPAKTAMESVANRVKSTNLEMNNTVRAEERSTTKDHFTVHNAITTGTDDKKLSEIIKTLGNNAAAFGNTEVTLEIDTTQKPNRYIFFDKVTNTALAEVSIKNNDVVIQLRRNKAMQWQPSKLFCSALAAEFSKTANTTGCQVTSGNPAVAQELFQVGVQSGIQGIYLSKKSQDELIDKIAPDRKRILREKKKEEKMAKIQSRTPDRITMEQDPLSSFHVRVKLDGDLTSIISATQKILSAGLIPVFDGDFSKLKPEADKTHHLYLPPRGKNKEWVNIRNEQLKQLEPFFDHKLVKGHGPLERKDNQPQSLITHVANILENGDTPDFANISKKHRDLIKEYIKNNPKDTTELIAVNINAKDPIFAAKQFNSALAFGLIPKLDPKIFDSEFTKPIHYIQPVITGNDTLLALKQCKAALESGINFGISAELQNKIAYKLHNLKTGFITVDIHCLDPERALKNIQKATALGFVAVPDDATQKSIMEYQAKLNILYKMKVNETKENEWLNIVKTLPKHKDEAKTKMDIANRRKEWEKSLFKISDEDKKFLKKVDSGGQPNPHYDPKMVELYNRTTNSNDFINMMKQYQVSISTKNVALASAQYRSSLSSGLNASFKDPNVGIAQKSGKVIIKTGADQVISRFLDVVKQGLLPELDSKTQHDFKEMLKNSPNKDEVPTINILSATKPNPVDLIKTVLLMGCVPVLDQKQQKDILSKLKGQQWTIPNIPEAKELFDAAIKLGMHPVHDTAGQERRYTEVPPLLQSMKAKAATNINVLDPVIQANVDHFLDKFKHELTTIRNRIPGQDQALFTMTREDFSKLKTPEHIQAALNGMWDQVHSNRDKLSKDKKIGPTKYMNMLSAISSIRNSFYVLINARKDPLNVPLVDFRHELEAIYARKPSPEIDNLILAIDHYQNPRLKNDPAKSEAENHLDRLMQLKQAFKHAQELIGAESPIADLTSIKLDGKNTGYGHSQAKFIAVVDSLNQEMQKQQASIAKEKMPAKPKGLTPMLLSAERATLENTKNQPLTPPPIPKRPNKQ